MIDIYWNADKFGVEIKTDDEHFVISAEPSMVMNWYDAKCYFKYGAEWKLPDNVHLELVARNLAEINSIIKKNNGYELFGRLWSCQTPGDWCGDYVDMDNGEVCGGDRSLNFYVRAVSVLN